MNIYPNTRKIRSIELKKKCKQMDNQLFSALHVRNNNIGKLKGEKKYARVKSEKDS